MPTYWSLFAGVGGFDLGLDAAGWRCSLQCELDEWKRSVLAHHWPSVERVADVRSLADDVGGGGVEQRPAPRPSADATPTAPRRARPDLVCGGFPCQDVSVAGKRAGLAGARTSLFHDAIRIVATVRPRAVLLENVPGLLTSNSGRDFGIVLAELADIGYGVAWRILDAQHFGVPQRRRRVFLLALPSGSVGAERAGTVLLDREGGGGDPAARGEAGPGAAGRAAIGVGSGVVIGALLGGDAGGDVDEAAAGQLIAHTLTKSTLANGTGHAPDECTYVPDTAGVRRLTPIECERLMGWPDHHTAPPSLRAPDSRRYAACGDGVVAPVAEWIGRRLAHHLATEEP